MQHAPSGPAILLHVLTWILISGAATAMGDMRPRIERVRATDEVIVIELTGAGPETGQLSIREWDPHVEPPAAGEPRVVWTGAAPDRIELPRLRDTRDRLYRKFQLVDSSGAAIDHPQFVTDLDGISARDFEIPWPEEVKGLTCIVDFEDAAATGIRYADNGLVLSALIDWANPEPEQVHLVDGLPVPINMHTIRALDAEYRRYTEHGIHFTPILINLLPHEPQPENPLIHPATDVTAAPMHHGAFNLADARGVRLYRGALEFFFERYTRPDAEHGWINCMVIGNELQQHYIWHNRGPTPQEEVIREYTLALRLADLAARSIHRRVRIFNSMTHFWSIRGYLDDPLREISGVALLEGINERARAEGNFPWHVAFHPYPENLFDPMFWHDSTATHRFDTPRITFRNLEVLPVWLDREPMLLRGERRRIMLTEQGFHTPEGEDGERIQAAAYAAAYTKVSQMPEIDAFQYHRHCSHRDEGGLELGLLDWDPDDPEGWRPGRRKFIWDVFAAAGTERQAEAFAFALPIVGAESWDAFAPDYSIDRTPAPRADTERVVFAFHRHLDEAELEGVPALQPAIVVREGGFAAHAFQQHPPAEGEGRATWRLELPGPAAAEKLKLVFDTAFTSRLAQGGRFAIEIDGERVFSTDQRAIEPVGHEVDLTRFGGQPIEITFITDALGRVNYAWAHWVRPRIVREIE